MLLAIARSFDNLVLLAEKITRRAVLTGIVRPDDRCPLQARTYTLTAAFSDGRAIHRTWAAEGHVLIPGAPRPTARLT